LWTSSLRNKSTTSLQELIGTIENNAISKTSEKECIQKAEVVAKGKGSSTSQAEIFDEAYNKGSQDNITAVVINLRPLSLIQITLFKLKIFVYNVILPFRWKLEKMIRDSSMVEQETVK